MSRFPAITAAARDFDSPAFLIDGEVVCWDERGIPGIWRTAGMLWGNPANRGRIMSNVAISLQASVRQRVAPFSRVRRF
jgi:hypothetical protein